MKKSSKVHIDFNRFLIDLGDQVGTKIHQKSIQNRTKIDHKMEVPADLDFFTILVDFGSQVGKENRAKTGQDRVRKGKKRQNKK